jgi:hypothetical protein
MKRTTFSNTKRGSEARGPWQHTASWKKQEEPTEVLIEEPLVEPDDVVSYITEPSVTEPSVTEPFVTEPSVTEPSVTETETETETEEEVSPRFKKVIAAAVLVLVLLIALLFVRNLRDDEGTDLEDDDEVVSIWEEVDFTTTSLYTD